MDRIGDLTPVAQDYLKAVWNAQEWSQAPVTTKFLADRMGVGPSTVSETVRRLTGLGLVDHAPYGAITLTDLGRASAVAMVRRHRLLESFLVSELGYGWDEVHDEAEVLEHAVSDLLIARIDAKLGHPSRDPHGDPIPALDGTVARPPAVRLSDVEVGGGGRIARIWDADPEVLRYLGDLGIGLDTDLRVRERRRYSGVLAVAVRPAGVDRAGEPRAGVAAAPERTVRIGIPAAEHVWVLPAQ